ncbi:MAG: hypothetical protein ABSF28_16860 [Terracidiphilus sp.]|jgi:hypothetical protein
MLRKMFKTGALAGWFVFAISGTAAQEVIHAYAGTVNTVDAANRTITVNDEDGYPAIFKDTADAKSSALLNKKLRGGVVSVNSVTERGTHVIVYYFTSGIDRVAVGLRNLGPGPFIDEIGTVVKSEERSIVIRSKSGQVQSFNISPDMIAETSVGVIGGLKFQPEKGDQVRITATAANGAPDALFIDGTVVI